MSHRSSICCIPLGRKILRNFLCFFILSKFPHFATPPNPHPVKYLHKLVKYDIYTLNRLSQLQYIFRVSISPSTISTLYAQKFKLSFLVVSRSVRLIYIFFKTKVLSILLQNNISVVSNRFFLRAEFVQYLLAHRKMDIWTYVRSSL